MKTLGGKRFQSSIVFILICVLMVSLLSGCGQSSGDNTTPDDAVTEETVQPAVEVAKEPEKVLDQLTITAMLRSFDVLMPNPEDDYIKKAIEEKFNVELKIEPVLDAQLKQKAGAYFASGSFPDVVAFRGFEEEFVKQGLFLPLDDYISQVPKFTEKWPKSDRAQWTFNGDNKVYGIPELRLSIMDNLWIRKDWLDKLQLPVPQNMQQLADAGAAFAEQDPDGNGKADTFGYFLAGDGGAGIGAIAVFERFFGTQFNLPFLKPDGTFEFGQFSESNYKALKFLKEQFIDRSMDPNWFFAKAADQQNMLNNGQIGIIASKVNFYSQTMAGNAENPIPGEWIALPDIKDPDGKQTKFSVNGFPYRTFFLTKDVSKEKAERFLMILEWMATPGEGYELITYGREGIEYEKSGEQIVPLLNPIDQSQKWRDNYRWFYDDTDPFWLAGLPEDIIEVNNKMLKLYNAEQYDLKPVNYLLDYAQDSYTQYNVADFGRFYNETMFEFLLGKRSFDKWEEFKQEGMEKFHFQEFIDHNTNRFKEKLDMK